MAEEKKVAEKSAKNDQADEKPRGGSNKLLMIVLALLVVLVGGLGGVAYLVLTGHNPLSSQQGAVAQPQSKPEAPPVFSKLDTFVVNLSGPGGTLLQVDMQAELADAATQQKLTDYMPKVRSAVILLLSAKTPEELATPNGKLKLKNQIKQVINGAMDSGDEEPVKNVVFTSFIIQNP
jgi:flagellar FliL protein